MALYVVSDTSLPRSLDVQISLSRPQAERRTNLTRLCLVAENLGLLPDANRIRFYSTFEGVAADFGSSSEPYKAAEAFFAQTPRANTMAIAEAFFIPQPARLVSIALSASNIANIAAINNGSMQIVYSTGGVTVSQALRDMDFTGVTTPAAIAAIIDAKTDSDLNCAVKILPGGSQVLSITTTATGDGVTINYPINDSTGTFVGALLKLTSAVGGKALNGYTPVDIASELDNITSAANANGEFIYGWCLGASLRDASIQTTAAEWALAHTAMMALTTNDVSALDPGVTVDVGSVIYATGNRRVVVSYHDLPSRYPDVSILAYMLSVNYQIQDSTVTAKFKQLPGIETVSLTESQWAALKAKGYNTYTAIGNSAKTYRDGGTEASSWYMDTTINLDNFVEDLSVNVFNVFLRNKKIPYTRRGQMLLVDACKDTGNQYIYNGTFADREVTDTTKKSGVKILPGVDIIPTPISQMSVADRASRIGPPIEMIVQEAGAIHSVAINVEVVA